MKLARAIHFDESDTRVFASPARTGEWCVSGGFEFSDWTEGDLAGKARQAFANGWLGLETFGRVTFVAAPQRCWGLARQRNRQSGAKGAGAENRDAHALAPFLPLPSSAGLVLSKGQRGRAVRSIPSRAPAR